MQYCSMQLSTEKRAGDGKEIKKNSIAGDEDDFL